MTYMYINTKTEKRRNEIRMNALLHFKSVYR